jgi:hypothetical protein
MIGHARHGLDGLGIFQKHGLALARAVADFAGRLRLEELELLVGAARDFEQVDAASFSHCTTWMLSSSVKPPLTKSEEFSLTEIGKAGPTRCRHRADHFQQQAGPVGQRAAPAVLPPIGPRRQELRQQVAVRRMHLDAIEAGFLDQRSGLGEAPDDVLDVGLGRRARLAEIAHHVRAGPRRAPAASGWRAAGIGGPGG